MTSGVMNGVCAASPGPFECVADSAGLGESGCFGVAEAGEGFGRPKSAESLPDWKLGDPGADFGNAGPEIGTGI